MTKGLWVWPQDERGQRRTLRAMSASAHLMAAMNAMAKSKDGLSNAEFDDLLKDNSNWLTREVVNQLMSLGFVEYTVQPFGDAGRYTLTELGRNAFQAIIGPQTPARQSQPARPAVALKPQ